MKKGIKELVAEAEAEIETLTVDQAKALAVDSKVTLVDLRDIRELERDGVIVTRQGKGSFVAENVDLGLQLKHEELSQHLTAAAEIGKHLGLNVDQLVDRLRDAAEPSAGDGQGKEEVA